MWESGEVLEIRLRIWDLPKSAQQGTVESGMIRAAVLIVLLSSDDYSLPFCKRDLTINRTRRHALAMPATS